MTLLFEFARQNPTPPAILGIYIVSPLTGPPVPSQPITAPVPFDTTVVPSPFLALNPNGSVTIGVAGEGTYTINYDVVLINPVAAGPQNRVDGWLAVNGTQVPGTRRFYNVGNNGQASTESCVEIPVVALAAGDVVSIEVGKFAGLGAGSPAVRFDSMIRIERTG